MTEAISIRVRGVEQLQDLFNKIPLYAKKEAVKAVGEYLIGNERRGLRHLVKQNYVSRKAAYGVTFFSDKQRKYVMARIREGSIVPGHYRRTGATAGGWRMQTTGGGYDAKLINPSRGAPWVMGDDTQSRHEAMVGHRKVEDVISTNIKGAMQAANVAVKKWIREHQPGGTNG